MVTSLLQKGMEKDAAISDGRTALMLACEVVEPKLAVVEKLLTAGADFNIRGPDNWTALGFASGRGLVPIMQALVRHGTDVNGRDTHGFSAFHVAATCDEAGAVDVLIGAGADIDLKSNYGATPLAKAAAGCKAKSSLLVSDTEHRLTPETMLRTRRCTRLAFFSLEVSRWW